MGSPFLQQIGSVIPWMVCKSSVRPDLNTDLFIDLNIDLFDLNTDLNIDLFLLQKILFIPCFF